MLGLASIPFLPGRIDYEIDAPVPANGRLPLDTHGKISFFQKTLQIRSCFFFFTNIFVVVKKFRMKSQLGFGKEKGPPCMMNCFGWGDLVTEYSDIHDLMAPL